MVNSNPVSYVPTPSIIIEDVLRIAQVGPEDVVFDLGSGDGRILIKAVEEFNVKKAVGYEIRKELFKASLLEIKNRNLQDSITIYNVDFHNADISTASVVILYLSPDTNESLRTKLEKELLTGARVVSTTFKINTWRGECFYYGGFRGYLKLPRTYRWGRFSYPIYKYIIPDAFR